LTFFIQTAFTRIEVLPKVAYYVKKTTTKHYLILGNGDFIQGIPESNFLKAKV